MKRTLLTAVAVIALGVSGAWAKSDINPDNYPRLDKINMGMVRHFVELSRTPLDSWSYRSFATGDNDLRYNIAHVSNDLALAQYAKTPAYRDLYHEAQDRLISKMLESHVWNYWYDASRLKSGHDPHSGEVAPWRDPVAKKNIMYSAYLFQMLGNFRTMYDDAKYDAPNSIVFAYNYTPYDPSHPTVDSFSYDYNGLAKVLYDQYVDSDFRGIECQPDLIFKPCNVYPQAAFIHYDYSHGTHYADKVIKGMAASSIEKTKAATMPNADWYMYANSTGKLKTMPAGIPDIVTATYEHIWDKARIDSRYVNDRNAILPLVTGRLPWTDKQEGTSVMFGFTVAYAAELGDRETVNQLLAFADKNLSPTWRNGEFFYPVNYPSADRAFPKGDQYGVEMLAGLMLGEARLNEGGTWWNIYNRPFDKAFFAQPYIGGVEYPRALVSQAIYDKQKDALIIGLEPGTPGKGPVTVDVHNLDKSKTYYVELDGKDIGTVSNGTVTLKKATGQWSADNVLTIGVDLKAARNLIIYAGKVS